MIASRVKTREKVDRDGGRRKVDAGLVSRVAAGEFAAGAEEA